MNKEGFGLELTLKSHVNGGALLTINRKDDIGWEMNAFCKSHEERCPFRAVILLTAKLVIENLYEDC